MENNRIFRIHQRITKYKDAKERIKDYKEFYLPFPEEKTRAQASLHGLRRTVLS